MTLVKALEALRDGKKICKKYKYMGHIIVKIPEDLGEDEEDMNYLYKIYKDGKFIQEALTLDTAKEYIERGYDENVL